MTETLTHFAFRTGQSVYQRCNRQWYWGYVWNGIGLTRTRLDVPLARGIFVHRGLEKILQGNSIDSSIKFALTEFDKEITKRGLDVGQLEEQNYVYNEQRALIEGMLYGWWKKRYPELIERYDVLEVEHEEVWEVGEFNITIAQYPDHVVTQPVKLVWLGKADALLREKDSGDLYLQSFKTTGEWDSRKDSAGMHDIQGLSELCAAEHRLREWWEIIHDASDMVPVRDALKKAGMTDAVEELLASANEPPKIMGIRMEHLLAGKRMEAKRNSGQKIQYSPLIRSWRKAGITPEFDELAWKYTWTDEFGEHRLGKGWTPVNWWEQPGGVRAWIDLLADGKVQAALGDALDQQFVYPQPYYRQAEDVEDWLQQTIAEELRKCEAVQRMNACTDDNERRFIKNILFPMFRHSCDYPTKCVFQDVCFGPCAGVPDQLVSAGMYQRRQPHHATEAETLTSSPEEG